MQAAQGLGPNHRTYAPSLARNLARSSWKSHKDLRRIIGPTRQVWRVALANWREDLPSQPAPSWRVARASPIRTCAELPDLRAKLARSSVRCKQCCSKELQRKH